MRRLYESGFLAEKHISTIAEELIKYLQEGDVIIFSGDLGAGKTTLIKLICSFWNIPEVSSPTFNIVNEYFGDYKVYHFDFYRVDDAGELTDIGFEDYLNDLSAFVIIEWGEKFPSLLPHQRKEVQIIFSEDNLSRKYILYENE
ncbi:MAG: tRNA (adenosine(37)-N6)-threonylcarbamoyltransferase complex ATPase subunit type 1 TsaE [Ignavibacteriales bacterium]|nr:tRNA (adenosine(37)-N6)-threonylcarbamoyltransferase complex ATPase subunit type 1 TsaE [Ignavibacteriales bacterium]MCF8314698.1 tRNA (adenosine(37)-N6)-threonylcarbamoyltransferase complex ATPase subunit type 1 TsaE [Ignavibacteriales bacterium]MCF8438054.1 tRNA (adenosine(37)-N6)-threonylcarbamoyltransferase complex ATPase subunit type 1 TsaE [Ignavibacteriales bacterium]